MTQFLCYQRYSHPGSAIVAIFVVAWAMLALAANAQLPSLPGRTFPVHIGAEGHVVQGRIAADARPGSLIPMDFVVEGDEDVSQYNHLRVEIRDSVYTRPHVYHPDIRVNSSDDPNDPDVDHPVIHFRNSTLPMGMTFVVIHTNAFIVDGNRYIVVNDFDGIAEKRTERVHFEVILKDTLSEIPYVSNHLPFIVEVETSYFRHVGNSAVSAGVLICVIVAFSLVIPFVVRAKRRRKAGKPICACGSADEKPIARRAAKYTPTTPKIEVTNEEGKISCVMNGYTPTDAADLQSASSGLRRTRSMDLQAMRDFLSATFSRQYSHESLSSIGSTSQIVPSRALVRSGGADNLALIMDNGRLMHQRGNNPSKSTIQNALIRSTSNIRFQPEWMDPHYESTYYRPEFHCGGTPLALTVPPRSKGHAYLQNHAQQSHLVPPRQLKPLHLLQNGVESTRNGENHRCFSQSKSMLHPDGRGIEKLTNQHPPDKTVTNQNVELNGNDRNSKPSVEKQIRSPKIREKGRVDGVTALEGSVERKDPVTTCLSVTSNTVVVRL